MSQADTLTKKLINTLFYNLCNISIGNARTCQQKIIKSSTQPKQFNLFSGVEQIHFYHCRYKSMIYQNWSVNLLCNHVSWGWGVKANLMTIILPLGGGHPLL